MPSTSLLGIGIDVSKNELVCAMRYKDHVQHITKTNTKAGIRALDNRFKHCACPVIMESTGRYHFLPALLLSEQGYDVRVVNPITAKRYMRSSVRNVKNDPTDATALAQMALLDLKLPETFTLVMNDIAIRQKISLLSKLEKQLQSLRMMQRGYEDVCDLCSVRLSEAEEDMKAHITCLGRTQERLAKELEAIICDDETMKRRVELLITIPGVSRELATILCASLSMESTHPKQWIAFVGLDVTVRQSGNWKGRGKLSKRGNPYLRKRLFTAAWGAQMNDELFAAEYRRLREEGRAYREALTIISRKILRIAFAVCKKELSYKPETAGMC
ncbi:IS110 family transposase [Patescibacteria group bacterium]|nr:IS110 family transposase [Patescibacteria group bacterium]MBU2259749.1 IS110 family transposase [Patescibacteria group bacterium]